MRSLLLTSVSHEILNANPTVSLSSFTPPAPELSVCDRVWNFEPG
jgi:hypothetical protein